MTGVKILKQAELSEAAFQQRVMQYAKLCGWQVVHYKPATVQSGRFVTPVSGDKGAPDLLLARRGVVILAELKRQSGRTSPEQKTWLEHIGTELGRLWRPADWDDIQRELR
jgi:hypothetical protein